MPVIIENKTNNRVLLRFNSGVNRYLAPREVLKDVEFREIKGNAHFKRLEAKHVLIIKSADAPAETKKAARSGAKEKPPQRSTELKAEEAIEHIRKTPLEALENFVTPDEDRVTVIRAMEEKRGS